MNFTSTLINSKEISEENLTIEVSTKCNSNCIYCFAKAGLEKQTNMTYETAKNIVKEGYDIGYRFLHLTGGEPLLWKNFFNLIEFAIKTGYKSILFNTNGILLTKEKSKIISEFGDKINFTVSLNGSKTIHEKLRGNSSYNKVISGIENAFAYNLKINIFTVVGKSLLIELPRYVNYIFNKFPNLSNLTLIQIIRVFNDAYDIKEEILTPFDFINLVQTVSFLNLYSMHISILENPLANVVADMLGLKCLPQALPHFRTGRVVILANKDITLSHSSRDSFGKYKTGILEKIFKSEKYYNKTIKNELCQTCKFMKICSANKMLKPSEEFRDFDTTTSFCKKVLELLEKKLVNI